MRDPETNLLLKKFIGLGEVKGKLFERVKTSKYVYMYRVGPKGPDAYYETFIRIIHSMYGTDTYPSSKQFGKTAFTSLDEEGALKIFKQLHKKEKKRVESG